MSAGWRRAEQAGSEGRRSVQGPECCFAHPLAECTAEENRRFRDDEFLLPLALTQARDAIRVRVKFTPVSVPLYPGYPLPALAWSEMRYTAYSFVMPKFRAK